jgi:hypothetical protein
VCLLPRRGSAWQRASWAGLAGHHDLGPSKTSRPGQPRKRAAAVAMGRSQSSRPVYPLPVPKIVLNTQILRKLLQNS